MNRSNNGPVVSSSRPHRVVNSIIPLVVPVVGAALALACSGPPVPVSSAGATPRSATPMASSGGSLETTVERLRVEVIERRPHDASAYTQGLVLADGRLYEGTGLYGQSTLREVELETGDILRSVGLDARYFGEGIAVVDDRIIQLTWQERTALVYRVGDLQQVETFEYDTQGWGLCDDGTRLVMSDGTNRLYFRDRMTFGLQGSVDVTNAGAPLPGLNELECVGDQVYANVYPTDSIVRIDPAVGRVEAKIDAAGLLPAEEAAGAEVLNGIAYDPAAQAFLVTGKYWPSLFEVRFVRQ